MYCGSVQSDGNGFFGRLAVSGRRLTNLVCCWAKANTPIRDFGDEFRRQPDIDWLSLNCEYAL